MAGDVVGTVVLEIEQRSVRLLCQFVLEPRDLAVALDDLLLHQCNRSTQQTRVVAVSSCP